MRHYHTRRGTKTRYADITVNGRLIQARENLGAALMMWRRRDCSDGGIGLMLWADALCINQEDIREREQEVLRMFHIYGRAFDVIIWIDDQADNSNLTLDLMALLFNTWDSRLSSIAQHKHSAQMLEKDQDYLGLPFGACDAPVQLLQRPYFARLWIVQEIAIGDPSSHLVCGTREMPWEHFFKRNRLCGHRWSCPRYRRYPWQLVQCSTSSSRS